jgi:hypothetical protein
VSVGRFRARSCSNERLCWFLKKTSRIAMTIIEIRPFQNGWTVFEAPGVKKSFLFSGTWFRRFRRRSMTRASQA